MLGEGDYRLRTQGGLQWHEDVEPCSVEAGSRAGAYSLCGQRLLYGTGMNLHCGATRLYAVNAVCRVACLA